MGGYEQQALDILNEHEAKNYMNSVQSKAVLQMLITLALKSNYQQGCKDQKLVQNK